MRFLLLVVGSAVQGFVVRPTSHYQHHLFDSHAPAVTIVIVKGSSHLHHANYHQDDGEIDNVMDKWEAAMKQHQEQLERQHIEQQTVYYNDYNHENAYQGKEQLDIHSSDDVTRFFAGTDQVADRPTYSLSKELPQYQSLYLQDDQDLSPRQSQKFTYTPPSQQQPAPVAPTRLRDFALNAVQGSSSSSSNVEEWSSALSSSSSSDALDENSHLDIVTSSPDHPSDLVRVPSIGALQYHEPQDSQAPSQREPQRFIGDDRIEINVGGRVFLTSKGTLMAHSTYFLNRWMTHQDLSSFSLDTSSSIATSTTPSSAIMDPRWSTLTPQGQAPEQIFLDQDPQAFEVLLAYMRYGYSEATSLTPPVLALADILGLVELIRAVKCTSFRYLHPSLVSASDDDVCRRFDQAYGGILPALARGLLPETIRPVQSEKAPKQIAQLLVYDGWVANLPKTDLSLFVEVKVTANVLSEEGLYHPRAEGFDTVVVPDCHTIHDALNWLYQRGFTFTEQEYQTMSFPNDHRAWENLWFTRPVVPPSSASTITNSAIRFDPSLYPQVQRQRRKIASLLISHDQMDAFLYADKGRKTRMGFPLESNGGLPSHIPSQLRKEGFDSKVTMESSRNAWAIVSWLSEHGYTEMNGEESNSSHDKLRKLLLEIQYRAFIHQEDMANPKDRQRVDQDQVDFRLLSCEVPPDEDLFETWPTRPFE